MCLKIRIHGFGLARFVEYCFAMPSGMIGEWLYSLHMRLIWLKSSLSLIQRYKVTKISKGHDIKLHLGCGAVILPKWINVDEYKSKGVDFSWDITKKLPLLSNCCKFIYSHHVIEHIEKELIQEVFRECYRVLLSNGIFRIAVPDLKAVVENYTLGKGGHGTPAETLNWIFLQKGHKFIYDYDELQRQLATAGFRNVKKSGCNESDFEVLRVDKEDGVQNYTLYLEAQK